jgi:hypothetical protein
MEMKCLLKYIKLLQFIMVLEVIKVGKVGFNLPDILDKKNMLALYPKNGCTHGLATIKEFRGLNSFQSMDIFCCQQVMMVLSKFGMYSIIEDA